ncbi:type IV secretory system conjugative DNA transfer family protein [Rhizobium herbae]|uniref:Type IV secretion system protein VirD4 n=1 Tax=Rhizobium herbae TaxID=508661 RepID=A0ABS4EW47_9HYPH|nr:type IV secretory system conjugative DNA transfer family protein [Rhizobium herbae]MBP1862183.1 type IV secretion system protein VirD4 [Rhizobium herbae]
MRFSRLLKSIVTAPVLAVVCTVVGILCSALLLLASFLIHLIGGFEPGQISDVIQAVAKYLPLVFGSVGCVSAFITDVPISSVFGSARWATGKELQKLAATVDGLLIGRDPTTNMLLRYDGPAHLLTIAPTRTGKGVGTIIPNLLSAERSVICIDPKGENAKVAGRAREQFGPVHILDPFGVTGKSSAAFNPLDMLDPDGLDVAEDANTLADALVFDEPGMSGDAHWNEEAKALIAGLILKIAVAESTGRRTLATLREYLTFAPERFLGLIAQMQGMDEANCLIARAANRHLGKSDREAAGVLSAAQRHTHFLDSPRMTAVVGRSNFRFADLKRNNVTVFLVLPPDRLSTYSRWLRLLITQSLTDMARDPGVPAQPVLYLLDEFAALGHLVPVERAMGLMAGYGVQLWPVLQDIHQLRATYGKRAGTFLSNAAVRQVFGVNDVETAELITRSIGKTDAQFVTRSWSDGKSSSSEHISARDLINADEIMRLPEDKMILLRQGQRPAWVRKLRYYADPEFKGAFDPV